METLIPVIVGLVTIVRLYFIISWARDRRNARKATPEQMARARAAAWGFFQSRGRWPAENELANILRAQGYKA